MARQNRLLRLGPPVIKVLVRFRTEGRENYLQNYPEPRLNNPKTGRKPASAKLVQSPVQGSDTLADGHKSGEELPIVVEASGASNEGQQN